MKRALFVAFFVAAAIPAFAQATVSRGPITPQHKFEWIASDNIPNVQTALTFEWRPMDGANSLGALSNVTCVAQPAPSTAILCEAPIGAMATEINRIGIHQLTLLAWRADVNASPQSAPFPFTSPANAPTGVRTKQPQ